MATFKGTKQAISREMDRQLRQSLREQRAALKTHVRALKERRKAAVAAVREHCKRSRARVGTRAKEIRAEHRKAANAEILELRNAAKAACSRRVERAQKRGLTEQQIAERERKQALRDERLIARASEGARKRQEKRISKASAKREDDDAVRQNIEPELLAVWEQMKDEIGHKPRVSRTEQFLQWVEENPETVIELQGDLGDQGAARLIAEAEAHYEQTAKALQRKTKLRATDFAALAINPDEMTELGLDPTDPQDVLTFMHGVTEYYQSSEAVPF